MIEDVEFDPDVVWLIRHVLSPSERDDFHDALDAIRAEPIGRSEAIQDPRLSPYMLRYVEFVGWMIVFEYAPAEGKIRILECRKRKGGR